MDRKSAVHEDSLLRNTWSKVESRDTTPSVKGEAKDGGAMFGNGYIRPEYL